MLLALAGPGAEITATATVATAARMASDSVELKNPRPAVVACFVRWIRLIPFVPA